MFRCSTVAERQSGLVWSGSGENAKGIASCRIRKGATQRAVLLIRRAHDFLTATGVSECPNCHEKKLPHRACAKCGEYKGRAVLETKEAAK